MQQQLIQKPRQTPDEPETVTKEETELDFSILDTENGVIVERTATTFAAEVLEQDGERQITIDEETDTTVFTITQEYDVALPDAWEQLDDHMPTMTAEHTAAWDILQLHFMALPQVDAVHEPAIDQFLPIEQETPETSTTAPLPVVEYSTAHSVPSLPDTATDDAYPEPDTPSQLYEYADLVDIAAPSPVQLLDIADSRYPDGGEMQSDRDGLLDDGQMTGTEDAQAMAFAEEDTAQYDADTDTAYQEDAMEHTVVQRKFDADETPHGLQHQLSYTVSTDTSGNAADVVEQLFAGTDLSGSVEKMTYQDTEDGYRTKESYWVDIDGMDMSRTEFFINGELAEDSLDEYDLDPGDSITFVEADLFDSSDGDGGGACGGNLYLDDVLEEYSDDEDVAVVDATYGPDSPAAQQPAQPAYMTGA